MAHSALNTVGQWEGELHRVLENAFNGRSVELRAHSLVQDARTAIIATVATQKYRTDTALGGESVMTRIQAMKRGKRRKLPVPESSVAFLTWKIQQTVEKLAIELDGRERVAAYLRGQASSPDGSTVTT